MIIPTKESKVRKIPLQISPFGVGGVFNGKVYNVDNAPLRVSAKIAESILEYMSH